MNRKSPEWVTTTFSPNTVISSVAVNTSRSSPAGVTALENHVETSIEMSDGNQNFSVTCLTTLNAQTPNVTNGAELVPLGCTLAAKRKCQGMNFAVGVFVGEVTATGGRTANCLN